MNLCRLLQWLLLLSAAVFFSVPKVHAAVKFPSIVQQQRSQSVTSILKQAEVGGAGTNAATTQALMNASPGTRYLPGMGGFTMASNYGVAPAAVPGVGVKVATDTTVKVAGKDVGVQVSGTISKADIASAVVGCVGGTLVGCAASVGIPLAVAYFNLSGARVNATTGEMEMMPTGKAYCYTAPCYEYSAIRYGNPNTTYWTRDPEEACDSTYMNSGGPGAGYVYANKEGNFYVCRRTSDNANASTLSQRSVSPLSPTWYPATPQEVKDKLIADSANNPPPPIVPELEKAGVDWNAAWKDPAVVGPSEVTGPKQTTVKPDGSTSVSQERTPLSYSGPTVTAGPSVKTETTTSPDGTTTETTTTTTEPGTEAPAEDAAPTDTDLPPVPDLYERKYPDGMEGIWNERKDQLKNTALVELASQLMPDVGSSGSCPSWPVNFSFAAWADFGTHDVAPACWIWDVARAIIILGALLLARALIFGG